MDRIVLWPTYSAIVALTGEGGSISVDTDDDVIVLALTPVIVISGTGVPDGGTEDQILTKLSDDDGDAGWRDRRPAAWGQIVGDLADQADLAAALGSKAEKFYSNLGDGAYTSVVITHNLGTRDLVASVRRNASPYDVVVAEIEFTTADTVTVTFGQAPAEDEYRLTLIGSRTPSS